MFSQNVQDSDESAALPIFFPLCVSLSKFCAVAIEVFLLLSVSLYVMTHPSSDLILSECHIL